MKCYILCIILISRLYAVRSNSSLDQFLRQVVNNFKDLGPTGDPSLGIPPFDPYKLQTISEDYDFRRLKVKLRIENGSITGVSKFHLGNLHVDDVNFVMTAEVTFDEINMTGQYDLKGRVYRFIPVYGNGSAFIGIKGFRINTTIGFDVDRSNGRMKVSYFNIDLNFNEIHIHLKNILGGGNLGKIVNFLLNAYARPMFMKHKAKLEAAIKEVVTKLLDKRLEKVDVREFFKDFPGRPVRSVK